MPQTTSLRRVSTLVVGALFAVVFVCSGASAAQTASAHGYSAVGAHTATSKAAVRTVPSTHHGVKPQTPVPPDLATTGPVRMGSSRANAVAAADHRPAVDNSRTLFTTSERAPPAH